ncbi:MAG: hypothetical protein ACM3VW_06495 [Bacteroidota bacterium]
MLGGCLPPASAPNAWRYSRTGHVYVARLLSEHPLYPQYQRLGQEIASLRKPCVIPTTPPVFLELGELFLPGPQPPRFPLEQFELRRAQWRLTLIPQEPAALAALDADVRAELRWAKIQAEEHAAAQLQRVQSTEDARVAEVRAAAVRAQQEALNNAGLKLTGSGDREAREARDAEEQQERQRLWAEIEQQVAAARTDADRAVAASRQQIDEDLRSQLRDLQAEASQRMEKRREIFVKSGSEIRTRMSKAMAPPEPLALSQGLSWQPAAAPAISAGLSPDAAKLLQREQRRREAQATLLIARRADLAAQIERGVELAVRRVAALESIRLTVPPMEAAQGPDVTEALRPALRTMFQS